MTLTSTLAALAMAFGAPLVYADQARNIINRRNAEGFSKDVCAVLLIANICRCFFWFGNHFELALLLQSVLMIVAQMFLLSLLIKYRSGSFASSSFSISSNDRAGTSTEHGGGGGGSGGGGTTTLPSKSTPAFQQAEVTFDISQPSPVVGQGTTASSKLWKNASSIGAKGYAPLLDNFKLPTAPVLGYEEGEEEEEERRGEETAQTSRTAKFRRGSSKAAKLLQAGFKMGNGKRLDGSSGARPFGFWTWQNMNSYYVFLALLVVFLGLLQLTLGYFSIYTTLLGYFALGLESTLPIPQAIINQKRKSLSGFRLSVLAGWLVGDLFKTVYFLIQKSPAQFTVCALFQLSIDFVICAQVYFFREKTAQDDEEMRVSEAEALEAGQARGVASNRVESEASLEDASMLPTTTKGDPSSSFSTTSHFRIEADDDE